MSKVKVRFESESGTVEIDGVYAFEEVAGSTSEAHAVMHALGYRQLEPWISHGVDFICTMEIPASQTHVWPSDIDFMDLAGKIGRGTRLDQRDTRTLASLLLSLSVARDTWDSIALRFPSMTEDHRNHYLVGALAAVIGRRTRR